MNSGILKSVMNQASYLAKRTFAMARRGDWKGAMSFAGNGLASEFGISKAWSKPGVSAGRKIGAWFSGHNSMATVGKTGAFGGQLGGGTIARRAFARQATVAAAGLGIGGMAIGGMRRRNR